jgi:hypothetical protein
MASIARYMARQRIDGENETGSTLFGTSPPMVSVLFSRQ